MYIIVFIPNICMHAGLINLTLVLSGCRLSSPFGRKKESWWQADGYRWNLKRTVYQPKRKEAKSIVIRDYALLSDGKEVDFKKQEARLVTFEDKKWMETGDFVLVQFHGTFHLSDYIHGRHKGTLDTPEKANARKILELQKTNPTGSTPVKPYEAPGKIYI